MIAIDPEKNGFGFESNSGERWYTILSCVTYPEIWRSPYGDAASPYRDTASPEGDAVSP